DFVADDAFEVVGESAGREEIRKSGRQVGVGGGVRIVVHGRLLKGLCPYERREVGIILVNERHESVFCQLGFPPVADGDFGGAFHVHPAVVGGESVGGQALD